MGLVFGIELVSRVARSYCVPIEDKDTGEMRFLRRTKVDESRSILRDAQGVPITFDDRETAVKAVAQYFKGRAEVRQIYV